MPFAEFQLLADETNKIRQEEAQFLFSVADYLILKLAQYSNESDQKSAWNQANQIRAIFTGQRRDANNAIADNELNQSQIVEYLNEKKLSGISYAEFITKIQK